MSKESFRSSGLKVADALVISGQGVLHTIVISCNDAAPTAGTIVVYDDIAETGTKLFSWTVTTAVFTPVSVLLDVDFNKGLYIGFTTTADVNVSLQYKVDV
jgi:hypothetical protein